MSSKLSKSALVIAIVVIAVFIVSAEEITAQPEKLENGKKIIISSNSENESKINQEIPKISPELQKIINESPDEIVLVTIFLKEQPLHNISQKSQEKYESKLRDIQSKVRTYYKEARKNALAKKISADINAYGKVKINDEILTDVVSTLTDAEKQNILEENSKFEKMKQEMIQEIITNTKEKIQPQQKKIKNKIEELGGSVEGEGAFYNVVFSRISANKINEIVDLPEVEYVEKTGISKPDMDTSVSTI